MHICIYLEGTIFSCRRGKVFSGNQSGTINMEITEQIVRNVDLYPRILTFDTQWRLNDEFQY
jgi:hypothetical protein